MSQICIGSRWKPGHVVRQNTEQGVYEEINPPLHTLTESFVQHALIQQQRASRSLASRLAVVFFGGGQ